MYMQHLSLETLFSWLLEHTLFLFLLTFLEACSQLPLPISLYVPRFQTSEIPRAQSFIISSVYLTANSISLQMSSGYLRLYFLKIKLDIQFLHNLQFEFIAVQSLQFFRPSPSKYMLKLHIICIVNDLSKDAYIQFSQVITIFFQSSYTFSTQTTMYEYSSLRLASSSNIIFYLYLTIRLLLNLSCCGFKSAFL